MAVCCQTLTLDALMCRSALFVLVGALFKKFSLFLNTPRMVVCTANIKSGNKMTVRHEKVVYKTNGVIMITFLLTAKQKKKKHWCREAFFFSFFFTIALNEKGDKIYF